MSLDNVLVGSCNCFLLISDVVLSSRFANLRVLRGARHLLISYPPLAEGNLQQHFRGRSHLKGLERQKTAEKSVFIRGLPSDVTKDALKCFLEKEVGCVSKIIFGSSVSPCIRFGVIMEMTLSAYVFR